MKYFKKIISLYRLLLLIPKQINELKKDVRELRNMNYSLLELNQKLIFEHYKNNEGTINLSDKGFRVHSQFEEDGLLLYIFSKIGFTNRRGVEMCCGWGIESMLANLILYHGFDTLLFDGDKNSVERARNFFSNHPNTFQHPPKIIQEWITKENINKIIKENGFEGEIDIFSLDVDGVDYYLIKELSVIKPRVVICEIHNIIPPNLALTIPYSGDFDYRSGKYNPEFRSVSILAMVNLMQEKGYRLVGSHKYGFNIIFIRNDLGVEFFPEINPEECFKNSYTEERSKVWTGVSGLPWLNV
jgi:hypothetical protein